MVVEGEGVGGCVCVRWQGGAANKCESCFRKKKKKKKPSRQIAAPYFISKDVALISFPEPMLGAVFEVPPPRPSTSHDGCLCRSSASYYGDAGDKHDRRRLRDAGAVRAAPRVIIVTFAAGGGGVYGREDQFWRLLGSENVFVCFDE